jgi:hypothetical protein
VRIRQFRESDVDAINAIWEAHHSRDFSVPNRTNSVIDAVVEDDKGRVIAYGQVKLFAEAMMILDLSMSQMMRAKAIKLLMHEAFRGTKQAGIENLYSFARDPDLVNLIRKHFGFEPCENPGDLLLRELTDGWRKREEKDEPDAGSAEERSSDGAR